MPAIVMNTQTGAVSEYDWSFQSLTPVRAASSGGLFELGGDTDDGAPIVSTFAMPRTLLGSNLKKRIAMVFFSIKGAGTGLLRVLAEQEWTYPFPIQAKGESRAKPGQGIRENYLGVGFSNVDGGDFSIDSIEVELIDSELRKTGK